MARNNKETQNTENNELAITTETDNGNVTESQATNLETSEIPNESGLTPNTRVDELQQIKVWMTNNGGELLAAMLGSLPQPVNKNITLRELTEHLNLAYEPSENVLADVESTKAPLRAWVERFGFNYQNLVLGLSRVNTEDNKFDASLAKIASTLSSINNDQTTFRGLF